MSTLRLAHGPVVCLALVTAACSTTVELVPDKFPAASADAGPDGSVAIPDGSAGDGAFTDSDGAQADGPDGSSTAHVRTIASGTMFTCALFDNGKVTCWGDSSLGQLGLGDPNAQGGNTGEMGDPLGYVDLGTK